ncbi:MAG TPA: hypothetical protein VNL15_06075 [Dehalococcoidia bacterium]|nr:hypothetical protein [Dehalococcoidia bacterium]
MIFAMAAPLVIPAPRWRFWPERQPKHGGFTRRSLWKRTRNLARELLGAKAIAATALTEGSSTTDGTSYSTASITPSANALVLASVAVYRNDTTNPGTVTAAGNSLTYVEIANAINTAGGGRVRDTLFRAMGASPTAGAITFTVSATAEGATWDVTEFTGVDTGGTNGSGAIVQSDTSIAGAVASLAHNLAAFGDATNNAAYASFACVTVTGNARTISTPTGFTSLFNANVADGVNDRWKKGVSWKIGEATSIVANTATDNQDGWSGVAVEIKIAAATGGGLIDAVKRGVMRGVLRGAR